MRKYIKKQELISKNKKITKKEFIDSIAFITNNSSKINNYNIKYNTEKYNFSYNIIFYPILLLCFLPFLNYFIFSLEIEEKRLRELTFTVSNLIFLLLNFVPSNYFTRKILGKIFKNKNEMDSYSLQSTISKKDIKDFKERKTKFYKINNLFKNNLLKKVNRYFKFLGYKNLLKEEHDNYRIYNSVSYKLIEKLETIYLEQNSKEILMKDLTEYTIKYSKTDNSLDEHIIEKLTNHYKKTTQLMEKKQLLIEASGLINDDENLIINNDLTNKIKKNNKILKILSI